MPRSPRHRRSDAATLLGRVAPQASRWVERSLAEVDPPLTIPQYLALERIDGGGAGAGELARGAGVSRPAASQLIASLVDLGLVERAESAADRRQRELRLSDLGRRLLRSARLHLRGRLAPLVEALPAPRRDELARALADVEGVLAGRAPPRRPGPPKPRP